MKIRRDVIERRFETASATIKYIGKSTEHKASTSYGELWDIYKITLDETGEVIRMEGPICGNWDDRASIEWE